MGLQFDDVRSIAWVVGQHFGDRVFALRRQVLVHFRSVLVCTSPLFVQHNVFVFLDLAEVERELSCRDKEAHVN